MALQLPDNFKNDIQGRDTSLVPVVVIGNAENNIEDVNLRTSIWQNESIVISTNSVNINEFSGGYSYSIAVKPILLNIPSLKESKRITAIDINPTTISIAKNRLFGHYDNVDFITSDVFDKDRYGRIKNADLIINASCENMKSMKELKPLSESKSYFAFQSNNMYEIHDSVNCVSSIEEFKYQMPDNAKILKEDTLRDDRGTRFTLIGQL